MRQALPGVADAAVHLNRGLAHRPRGARAVDLCEPAGPDRLGRVQLVDRPGGVPQDAHRTLDQGQAFGQQVRDGLVRADRLAVLLTDFRVVAGQRVRTARRSDQVGRRGRQRERQPSLGGIGVQIADGGCRSAELGSGSGQVDGVAGSAHVGGRHRRAVQRQRAPVASRVDRVTAHRDRRPGAVVADVPGQVVGQHRTEERGVDQSAAELLGDDGHFDAGGAVGAQRSPAGRLDLLVETGDSLVVGEVVHRARSEVVGELRGCVSQLLLFSCQTYIHSAP